MSSSPLPASPDLLVEVDRGIATVTLNRPARKNSVTSQGWLHLRDTFRAIDPHHVRAVIITGSGGTFCAGADLAAHDETRSNLENMEIVGQACLELFTLPVPTIAAVDGHAVGAGMNLALACDFVLVSERAVFSQIFARRALSVDFGGSWLLPRLVGMARAKELIMLADFVDSARASQLGLVHQVVPSEQLQTSARALAETLAAGPQTALSLSKALLNQSFETSLVKALEDEGRAQALNLVSDDAQEAFTAFLEKRPATFNR